MSSSPAPLMKFEERGAISIGTVESAKMLDGANVTEFGNEVLAYVKEHPSIHLLLNFENVTYMSSAGLTELLRVNQALKGSKGSVRLCSLTENIRNVFEITNLEKLFFIHDDDSVDKAHKRFERSLAIADQEEAWAEPEPNA